MCKKFIVWLIAVPVLMCSQLRPSQVMPSFYQVWCANKPQMLPHVMLVGIAGKTFAFSLIPSQMLPKHAPTSHDAVARAAQLAGLSNAAPSFCFQDPPVYPAASPASQTLWGASLVLNQTPLHLASLSVREPPMLPSATSATSVVDEQQISSSVKTVWWRCASTCRIPLPGACPPLVPFMGASATPTVFTWWQN